MDRFKPREDRFAFIVALGRTFISLQELVAPSSVDALKRPYGTRRREQWRERPKRARTNAP
jgi:hypothetical protein